MLIVQELIKTSTSIHEQTNTDASRRAGEEKSGRPGREVKH
jgi:hypothetical protein